MNLFSLLSDPECYRCEITIIRLSRVKNHLFSIYVPDQIFQLTLSLHHTQSTSRYGLRSIRHSVNSDVLGIVLQ